MSDQTWAIYRIHYGLDYLKQSIESVIDCVDRIFIFYSVKPWVVTQRVRYRNQIIRVPRLHENVLEFLQKHYSDNVKVQWHNREYTTPLNQFRLLYEEALKIAGAEPRILLMLEPDMVFYKPHANALIKQILNSKYSRLSTKQIELWKTHEYRVPYRNRPGVNIIDIKREPKFQTNFGMIDLAGGATSNIYNYNFGFCFNRATMFYKHIQALVFSPIIGDTIPNPDWYITWKNWNTDSINLEISKDYEYEIPFIIPFKMPKEMMKQL